MRTFKALLLVLAISVSSVLSATTNNNPSNTTSKNPKVSSAVAKEVVNHLKNPKIKLDKDVLVFVKFTLNDDNQMVVLSVDTKNWEIDNFIKNRLNYKELKAKSESGLKSFILPVRINASL